MPYQHAEAYCLMKYASDDGSVVEWLWNSRDGVTPFIIRAADGETELHHVDMYLDRRLPHYQPAPVERIFVDQTPELLRTHAVTFVERYWEDERAQLRERFADQSTAIEQLIIAWRQPGSPVVIRALEWKRPGTAGSERG